MPQPANQSGIVRFGPFEVDLVKAELRKHGLRLRIQEQPFQVLTALLEHPGEVVSREELVRRLWPNGTFVDFDRGLNAAVTRLRRTLSDSAESPRYVETVSRQGYRLLMLAEPLLPTETQSQEINRGTRRLLIYGALLALLSVAGLVLALRRAPKTSSPTLTQLTDFTDSATAPALSPDGRTVAYLRGADWFLSGDQIWVQSLPEGEPVQLTNDSRRKFALAFSPDGSRLAYSVVEPSRTTWDTVTVPVLGGEPRLLMANAEGLTWIGNEQLLFSEIQKGIHMRVVTAAANRSQIRDVYVPDHERAMAHFSYLSPNHKWVLIVEMDHTAAWRPCRLVPFDGSSKGRQVGPSGQCTSAGWSPDGKWMYFTVAAQNGQHLWRQSFAEGAPKQLTLGPAEAQGVAVAPDGRSLITSMGMQNNAIWIHDSRGDRAISSVGKAFLPKFSPDGTRLFYLLRRSAPDPETELWAVDLKSERQERLLSGMQITGYDVADSGSEIVFAVRPAQGKSQIWLASVDRRSPPVQLASEGEDAPYFALDGQILFRASDGSANYLLRMNRDGSARSRVVQHPILNVMSISPDRRWIAALVAVNDAQAKFAEVAIPVQGGAMQRICSGYCIAQWAPDGRFFYVTMESGSTAHPGDTVVIPVPPGRALPELPSTGIRSVADGLVLSRGAIIEQSHLAPGPKPSIYAYVKTTMHRNLFRVPIP